MTALKEYTVHINGIPHTMLLSEEDAKSRGVLKEQAEAKAATKPKSK